MPICASAEYWRHKLYVGIRFVPALFQAGSSEYNIECPTSGTTIDKRPLRRRAHRPNRYRLIDTRPRIVRGRG